MKKILFALLPIFGFSQVGLTLNYSTPTNIIYERPYESVTVYYNQELKSKNEYLFYVNTTLTKSDYVSNGELSFGFLYNYNLMKKYKIQPLLGVGGGIGRDVFITISGGAKYKIDDNFTVRGSINYNATKWSNRTLSLGGQYNF